jgi:crotonobetainyl-CoA:carnitine CoA-transferase CaiB-like acyl-CoA transferase
MVKNSDIGCAYPQSGDECVYPFTTIGSLPLTGVRVLDLSQVLAAPFCTTLLSDLGAEVIKVEPPTGDLIATADEHLGPGWSAYYASVNRNKRYITLDYSSPVDRARLLELVRETDVVVLNLRPRSLEKLRLGYPELAGENARLIYCLITGFGEKGPRSDSPGMDLVAQALGGLMGTTGEPDRPPVKASSPVSDFAASLYAVQGILAALIQRGYTGSGCKISVNLLDATLAMLSNFVPQHFATGEEVKPVGGGHPQLVPYQSFEAADGHFVVACITQEFWLSLCDLLGQQEWKGDPRFRTNTDRRANRAVLVALLSKIFITQPRAHWIELLGECGVPSVEVNRFSEVFEDPQIRANGTAFKVAHEEIGEYTIVRNPILIDDAMLPVRDAVGRPDDDDPSVGFTPRPTNDSK